MTIEFGYEKKSVLQALRYHFLSRPEIRMMIILVNVFTLLSIALFYFRKIMPVAFLMGAALWLVLMVAFWFFLPGAVYRRSETFRDRFSMHFDENSFSLGNERGRRSWQWSALSKYLETPAYFYFYFDARSFFLVPKDSFANSDEVFQLRQWLKQGILKK